MSFVATVAALVAPLVLGAPPTPSPAPPAAPISLAAPPPLEPASDANARAADLSRYATLEAQAPEAAEFRGGDGTVIVISTGAAILILVLVVLLL